jgi:hypothetical protein
VQVVAVVRDGATLVREEFDVDRLTAALANTFEGVSLEQIELHVRQEFARWSAVPVRDFVPIFIERALRGRMRAMGA